MTIVIIRFPNSEFPCSCYSKLREKRPKKLMKRLTFHASWNPFSFSRFATHPYLTSNIKYLCRYSFTHLIALLQNPLFASQRKLLMIFVVCILSHLRLFSPDLLSLEFICWFFHIAMQFWVDTNTELIVLCVISLWCSPLYTAYGIVFNLEQFFHSPDVPLSFFSLHLWLRSHISLLSSLFLCCTSYCAFLEEIRSTLFLIFFMSSLYILIDIKLVSFYL